MSMITGPELDEMKQELVTWWLDTRRYLIAQLEKGYPYGSVELSPDEQIQQFVNMRGPDWINLGDRLRERFRGERNLEQLVQDEMTKYQERMYTLMRRR